VRSPNSREDSSPVQVSTYCRRRCIADLDQKLAGTGVMVVRTSHKARESIVVDSPVVSDQVLKVSVQGLKIKSL
jgi:hypothetical protein